MSPPGNSNSATASSDALARNRSNTAISAGSGSTDRTASVHETKSPPEKRHKLERIESTGSVGGLSLSLTLSRDSGFDDMNEEDGGTGPKGGASAGSKRKRRKVNHGMLCLWG